VVRSPPAKDRPSGSLAMWSLIRCSRHPNQRVFVARVLHSSQVLARHGTPHPLGQTLIVTSGLGWAQRWGGPIEEIRPGDVVWFPPGEKHWHGASPTTAMTHIAIQEALNGKVVDWMEHVSDEQYVR
jgi:quercetin dioxygenase-like cupin family protein